MPLLKKKVFQKASPQEFLRDDEEVFFCEVTNEIFRNYEEFAERMLLCTSMVWTCALTGKSNLTYEEALESEENARRSISEFPVELRIPVLYVASKTKRTAFGEMAEDVFLYCKDRYFIGEKVESSFTANKWVESHVLQVIGPSEGEIKKLSSPSGSKEKEPVPPPSMYKYEIEHLDADDADISEIMIVDHNQIRRKKAHFSREKCKLFLKQYVQQDANSHWIIKPSAMKEFRIEQMKFDKIFTGPEPAFDASKKYDKKQEATTGNVVKKSRQETLAKYLTKLDGPAKMKMNGTTNTSAKKNKEDEAKSAQFLEEMERRKEEYMKVKQQKEEDQKLIYAQLRKWHQLKEDLELEDQQPLPSCPNLVVPSKLPEKYIGDVIMILEFINSFKRSLNPRKFIQGKLNLELMERALLEKEVAGPLTELIMMFLNAFMREQEEERQDYSLYPPKASYLSEIDMNNMTVDDAARFATLTVHWPKNTQGKYLRELPLYSLTASEILRLHLLSSGSKLQEGAEKKRHYIRGGYWSSDDPGLYLRINKPHILKKLAVKNVTELRLKDKMAVLSCLMHQLLTYPNYRNAVEEKREKSLQVKTKLKTLQREHKKRESEFNSSMWQLKRKGKKDSNVEKEIEELTKADEKRKLQIDDELEESGRYVFQEEMFLGWDRAYRKYYKLDSLGGIFIDSTEENPGDCLPNSVKQVPELVNGNERAIRKYLEKNIQSLRKNGALDDCNGPPMTNGVPKGSDTKSPSHKTNGSSENGHDADDADVSDGLLMCSGDQSSCVVHSEKRENRWKVIPGVETFDQLCSALNKRGIREAELGYLLQTIDRDKIERLVDQTAEKLWNKDYEVEQPQTDNKKKPYGNSNFGFEAGTSIDTILQNTLTDEILDLEEKIITGCLGQFRGKSREEWRNALSNKDYKNFDREINRSEIYRQEVVKEVVKEEEDDVVAEVKTRFGRQDPGNFLVAAPKTCDSDSESDDVESEQPSDNREAVQCLSIALAQVAHSIEPRFLKKPLGDSDGRKLAKVVNFVPSVEQLKRWEESLLLATSFSQLFLYYNTLESSIMWTRSTHQLYCKLCRKKNDSGNMLLCDNCNSGFHLYCLKPKLESVPEGDWFCETCDAARVKAEPIVVKVEVCATCDSGGKGLVKCGNCEMCYHRECLNPPLTRARVDWVCDKCKEIIQGVAEETEGHNNNEKGGRRSKRYEKDPKKEEPEDSDSGDSSKNLSKRKRSFRNQESSRDDLPLHNAALQDLLKEVMKVPDAWPFLRPVKNNEVPDYHDVISQPMDFGTIKYKLNMGEYHTDSQMMNDCALVFQNCNTYNEENSEIHRCGMKVLKSFRNKCEELGLDIPSKLAEEVPDRKRRRKLY